MIVKAVEVTGFRCFREKRIELGPLAVITGEMGSGKTSVLLALLFALTGKTPSQLTIDDLTHVEHDVLSVKIEGEFNGQPYTIERRKRRGATTYVKGLPEGFPKLDERIYVDGREVVELFIGAPLERALKIDELLGLSRLHQIAFAISPALIEKRIGDLERMRENVEEARIRSAELTDIDMKIREISNELALIDLRLSLHANAYNWARELIEKYRASHEKRLEAEGIRHRMDEIRQEIEKLTPVPPELIEEVSNLEERYQEKFHRLYALRLISELLALEEKPKTCPICGTPITSSQLRTIRKYEEEKKMLEGEVPMLESQLREKKAELDKLKSQEERRKFLEEELHKCEEKLAELKVEEINSAQLKLAEEYSREREGLLAKKEELERNKISLEGQKKAILDLTTRVSGVVEEEVREKIARLRSLVDRINNIKRAYLETLSELRSEYMERFRASFKRIFKEIYPYDRILDVDYEKQLVKGREILMLKAKIVGEKWLYPHMLSTGENVSLGLAILFAINELENMPILLFDEPDEGLDETGIRGLADILKKLSERTQVVIATRNTILASLLRPSALELILPS